MIYIFNSVRKRKLSIDLSLWWSVGAVLIFLIGCFPNIIVWISGIVGVEYPPSLLFLISILLLIVLILNNTMVISELKEKNKNLVQKIALLEKELKSKKKTNESTTDHTRV